MVPTNIQDQLRHWDRGVHGCDVHTLWSQLTIQVSDSLGSRSRGGGVPGGGCGPGEAVVLAIWSMGPRRCLGCPLPAGRITGGLLVRVAGEPRVQLGCVGSPSGSARVQPAQVTPTQAILFRELGSFSRIGADVAPACREV